MFQHRRSAIALRHVAFEDMGLLAPIMEREGWNVVHRHGDSFDLPDAASRLASNPNYDNQAFAYGDNALALQFHLEAEPRQLEEWFVGHAVELAAANVSVTELRAATSKCTKALAPQADRVFTEWLDQIWLREVAPQPSAN